MCVDMYVRACVHVCAYINVYVYIYIHMYTCVYIHIHIHIYTYMYVYIYIYTYIYIYMYIYIHIYIYMYFSVRANRYVLGPCLYAVSWSQVIGGESLGHCDGSESDCVHIRLAIMKNLCCPV